MLTITHCPFCLGHLGPAHCGHSRMNSKWANTVNHLCFMGKIGLYSDFILASVLVVGTTSLRDVTAFSFHYFPYLLYSYSKLNPPLLHSLPTGSHIQEWCWLMTSLPNDSWKQHGRRGKKRKKKVPPNQRTYIFRMEKQTRRGLAPTNCSGGHILQGPSFPQQDTCLTSPNMSAYFP